MLMMMPPLSQYFWFHSIYSVAASYSLQSAVCSLQMSYTEFSTGSYFTKTKAMVKIQKKNFGLGFSQ